MPSDTAVKKILQTRYQALEYKGKGDQKAVQNYFIDTGRDTEFRTFCLA